jgi:hypothetical protein
MSPLKTLLLGLMAATFVVWGFSSLVSAWIAMAERVGAREAAQRETWRGATVLKVCQGTTIYRLRSGEIVAGGYRVENPETVCEAP